MAPGCFEVVIGLEVHAQLSSATKLFCPCPTSSARGPNHSTCPICLGLPGVLPSLNRQCVTLAMRAALALGCTLHTRSQFVRKSYFYPDLPKGFQITQLDHPLATRGHVCFPLPEGPDRRVRVSRLHLEEDAGRSRHDPSPGGCSRIDFDRCGVPLIEVVSEPGLRSSAEAVAYLKELRYLLRYIGVCDGNLEDGSFRCDANLSLRPRGSEQLGVRTEIKNLNSFRHVRLALEHEAVRQAALLEAGEEVVRETRLFDEAGGCTRSMRGKEESSDYRYFPEPDLPELKLSEGWIEQVRGSLAELPWQKRERYRRDLDLPAYDASVLSAKRGIAEYFEALLAGDVMPGQASSWVMTELMRLWDGCGEPPVSAGRTAELLRLLSGGSLTRTMAKAVWRQMRSRDRSATEIMEAEGLQPMRDLAPLVEQVLAAHPREVERYRRGKKGLMGFFIGQVMKATRGNADASRLAPLLAAWLEGEDP